MLIRILIIGHCFCYVLPSFTSQKTKCLTGYVTDRQSWVNEFGQLTGVGRESETIDLSKQQNPLIVLEKNYMAKIFKREQTMKYLSMANCHLSSVPEFQFFLIDLDILNHIEYWTLYGNRFNVYIDGGTPENDNVQIDVPARLWSDRLRGKSFLNLKELDLRSCSIEVLDNHIFAWMPKLQALYLGENRINHVAPYAFEGLVNLVHLDISRNVLSDVTDVMNFQSAFMFSKLDKLATIDFSYTKLTQKNMLLLRNLGVGIRSLSLCESGLTRLDPHIFNGTSLATLDVSGNPGILQDAESLFGIESTLKFLYADHVNLKSFEVFKGLRSLVALKLSNNDLSFIRPETARSLKSLIILDLDYNRISAWWSPTFFNMTSLLFLSMRNNNINLLSDKTIKDFSRVKYVGLAGNNIVCNCYTKDLFNVAYKNSKARQTMDRRETAVIERIKSDQYNTAYDDYMNKVSNLMKMTEENYSNYTVILDHLDKVSGDFVLYDYDPETYKCVLANEGTSVPLYDSDCEDNDIGPDYTAELRRTMIKLIIIPFLLLPVLVLTFFYRKDIRYCFITMRNSTTLGMINNPIVVDDGTIFNYDVFVSYCKEDRPWVLDNFLPQIERDSGISVCLHERDFQVGLSILENIVSCMDRSRSIMLILSQRFLQSQWCQFEMHLAQHRLLETRREDLILILLEDIPRKIRPNTLHYLMLTKTYIVWPIDINQQSTFWKRLKRSLITQKAKYNRNVSLA